MLLRLLHAARRSVRTRIMVNFGVILMLVIVARGFSHWVDDVERARIEAIQQEYTRLIDKFLDAYQASADASEVIGRRLHGDLTGDLRALLDPLRGEVADSMADLRAEIESQAMRAALASAEQGYAEVSQAADRLIELLAGLTPDAALDSQQADDAIVSLWQVNARFSRLLNTLAKRGLGELDSDIEDARQSLSSLYALNTGLHFGLIVIALILVYRLGRSITRPIDTLTDAVEEFSQGRFGQVGVSSSDEFGRLAECFEQMGEQIERQITEGKRVSELALLVCATLDMDEIAGRLLDVARQFTRAKLLVLVLENTAASGWTRYTLGESGPVRRDSIAAFDPGEASAPAHAGTSLISIPLAAEGRVVGSLEIRGHQASPEIRRQANLISSLLVSVAMTLRNAQLFAQVSLERERVAEKAGELESAYADLERTQRFKSRLLASLGHQLRTPLSAVIGCADLLGSGVLGDVSDRQREAIDTVLRCGHTLHLAFDRILNYARLEAGEVDMLWAEFDVAEALDDARGRVLSALDDRGFETQIEVLPGAERWISDPVKVRHVVQQLLEHAALFAEAREVRIRAERRTEGGLVITVRDDGRGFSELAAASVFEPFQGDDPLHDTDLRLSIARSLSRLLGGDLVLTETSGSGSTFELTVPHHPVP